MRGPDLREMRKAAGFKGYELAAALDITPATLSRYERGHVPVPTMVALAVMRLCENTAADRLVSAIREVANGAAK